MTRAEVATLLTLAAARDRRTIGQADVAAWFEDLGDLNYADAREALGDHFRESTDWLMPAHIRTRVRIIRDRRRHPVEVRELPSRFEDDEDRRLRVFAGIAECAQALGITRERRAQVTTAMEGELSPSDRIRQRAIERARQDRLAKARRHLTEER
jgi:hypothetical protein